MNRYSLCYRSTPVADLGERDGGPGSPPPLISGKKDSQKEEKPAGQAKKTSPSSKLKVWIRNC